ncbi:MAG TPA: hypothetical protein PLU49_01115 [Saprospiraceae bacterium]|nr:hypothetical protein [Saprospiraceae bacterium]
MKTTSKAFLLIFFSGGLTYGFFLLLTDLVFGYEPKLKKFIFSSIFFGALLSTVFLSSFITRLRKNGIKDVLWEHLKVGQKRILKTRLNIDELMALLKRDPIYGKMNILEIEKGIMFKTGISLESWGEVIKIIQLTENDHEFEYEVSSRPRLKTTIFDFGKNLEHMIRIEKLFLSIL